ncbi:MAG: TerB family tellurite resistance protein [Gammaproteobacteria bacterium]|nr:TerB family tellurite resistance protein [Gammaproteobacteria bacterium]
MIRSITQFFEKHIVQQATAAGPSEHQLQLATAALLLEVSRADYSMDNEEIQEIANAIKATFNLGQSDTDVLLELADEQSRSATSLHGFTSLINERWPMEEKIKIIEHMWRVAYADDRLDKHERHLLRKVGGLLYIPHREFISAKMRAKDAFRRDSRR